MQTAERTASEIHGVDPEFGNTTKVCFVCSGNTCRSPMAASVFNHLNKDKDRYAVSAGLFPAIGQPISENAVLALQDAGITADRNNRYTDHTALRADGEFLSGCDIIIGITEAHTLELMGRFPDLASRIYSMPKSIPDPWGGDFEVYKECLAEITEGIKEFFHIDD